MSISSSYIIGVSGRSGSGKTTLVKKLIEKRPEVIAVHTMDNYYRPRPEQEKDHKGYLNFDLPTSFYREKFYADLLQLHEGKEISLPAYDYNNTGINDQIVITPKPIIIIEGLFIYHYEEIANMIDYRVMVSTEQDHCYNRRLNRDQTERNYKEPEINYRYNQHAEPAFQNYILPYWDDCDFIVDNTQHLREGLDTLINVIDSYLNP